MSVNDTTNTIAKNKPARPPRRRRKQETEDHIIKKTVLTGPKVMADKITNDIFVYGPKGFRGSRNSNFYEFLSLGIIPNIVGSTVLIASFNALNIFMNPRDAMGSKKLGKPLAIGVCLYPLFKWAAGKTLNKGVELTTGIDPDMPYKRIAYQLPEKRGQQPPVLTEFHKVYESVDFPRWDLLNKMGEEKNDRNVYWDKIAKKMGYKDKLNAPDQLVQPKIREVMAKTTAAKYITGYLWAAVAIALASQKGFASYMNGATQRSFIENVKRFPKETGKAFADSFKSLWKGDYTVKASKVLGKVLILSAVLGTVFGIANANRGFRKKPDKVSELDPKQESVVC